jgi:hypothetical protein
MTHPMVERLAREIYQHGVCGPDGYVPWIGGGYSIWQDKARSAARAVLEALLEPDEQMVKAGASVTVEPQEGLYEQEIGEFAAAQVITAAIRSLLEEK